MDAELRREAAGEIKGQIVELLRSVERAVVAAASGDTLGLLEEREADNFLGRLTWLLGLSTAERAFVDAAASEAAGGEPGEAYAGLMVFADWLEDQGRSAEAGALRRLVPAEGEILVMSHPEGGRQAAKAACDYAAAEMDRLGRAVHFVALAPGWSLEKAGPIVEGKLREQFRAEEFAALMAENASLRADLRRARAGLEPAARLPVPSDEVSHLLDAASREHQRVRLEQPGFKPAAFDPALHGGTLRGIPWRLAGAGELVGVVRPAISRGEFLLSDAQVRVIQGYLAASRSHTASPV